MDLVSKKTIEVCNLALDGLSSRHKALSANIANADTPGYQRTDVRFEDQLARIVESENIKQKQKEIYSAGLKYSPNYIPTDPSNNDVNKAFGMLNGHYDNLGNKIDPYAGFDPEIMNTNDPPIKTDGNNVNIEYEMAEIAKNGTKYNAIATFEEKMFRGMVELIRGAN